MNERLDGKDVIIIRYLCNETSDSETQEIEEELLRDEELDQRLQVVEMNLIDRYVRDEMSVTERARFETGFLATPENQLKVEDAQLFHESLNWLREEEFAPPPPVEIHTWGSWSSRLYQLPAPVRALAMLALLAAGVLGVWLISRDRSTSLKQSAQVGGPAATPETAIPTPSVLNNTSSPAPSKAAPVILPPTERSLRPPGNVTAQTRPKYRGHEVWLSQRGAGRGLMAGEEEFPIKIPPNRNFLRLKVELFEDAWRKTFQVIIYDKRKQRVIKTLKVRQRFVKDQGHGQTKRFILVNVPTAKLEDKGSYAFRIAGLPGELGFTTYFVRD